MLSIQTSANDILETEANGFTEGNAITYRIWDTSEGKEGVVTSTLLQGTETFVALGSAYVELEGTGTDLAMKDISYPNNFQLQSVYPNPFNPTTNITYELAENSNVKMEIYDLSGKLINSLVNEFQPMGLHSINWNAKSQPSGIYFLQLTTNNHMETRKITHVK
jgi:hypothetical protein